MGHSGFLGLIAVYYIEADTAEQAWPLKPSSSLDFNWLKMSQGKKEIWKITQPFRSKSVFQPLVMGNMSFIPERSTLLGQEVLPPNLTKLCDLDAFSTVDNNPYYAVASGLAQVFKFDDKLLTIMNFLQSINSMRQDYKRLLEPKDARALLLLAYWYAKVCQTQHWWLWHRAAPEGQAICIYLGKIIETKPIYRTFFNFQASIVATLLAGPRTRRLHHRCTALQWNKKELIRT